MRLSKAIARERLQRIRARAHAAWPVSPAQGSEPSKPVRAAAHGDSWFDQPPGRRRRERLTVSGQVSVRRVGSFGFLLPLGDVSTDGCQVELVESVAVDDCVIARLPGLEPFGAKVAWVAQRSAGIHFDRPMHPAVFDQLLSRLG